MRGRELGNQLQLFQETRAAYLKYGWRLQRVLMHAETLAQLQAARDNLSGSGAHDAALFEGVPVQMSEVDAIWFARPSHAGREAWELRLVAETPFALFEVFEADEAEEDREGVRREMEARLIERMKAEG